MPDRLKDAEIVTWAVNNDIPGYYDEDERWRLLSLLKQVKDGGKVVELGVQFGKTASIIMLESQRRPVDFDIMLVDNWCEDGERAKQTFTEQVWGRIRVPFTARWGTTAAAAGGVLDESVDLLHIDADHGPGVWKDCILWLPKVRVGGVVVFHDYQRRGADGLGDVFPCVTQAVDACINKKGVLFYEDGVRYPKVEAMLWEPLGRVNTQFAARRR